jgi:hypothetical protein
MGFETDTQEKNYSDEANSYSASQEIFILWRTKSLSLHDILSHRNPVHIRWEEINKRDGEEKREQEM